MLQPFSGVRIASYFSDRCVTTCIRVGLSHTKNGFDCCLALSINAKALSRMTSLTVSMLYLMFGIGRGGNGPPSTIFCLPTLPQRGSTVGSSTSLATEDTRLRGPTLFRRAGG